MTNNILIVLCKFENYDNATLNVSQRLQFFKGGK